MYVICKDFSLLSASDAWIFAFFCPFFIFQALIRTVMRIHEHMRILVFSRAWTSLLSSLTPPCCSPISTKRDCMYLRTSGEMCVHVLPRSDYKYSLSRERGSTSLAPLESWREQILRGGRAHNNSSQSETSTRLYLISTFETTRSYRWVNVITVVTTGGRGVRTGCAIR
jgi:hypothetical protein